MNNFSKGMKRQVFISLALAIKPKYLLLDEAFDGLDPLARLACKRAIIDLVEEKQSQLLFLHILLDMRTAMVEDYREHGYIFFARLLGFCKKNALNILC